MFAKMLDRKNGDWVFLAWQMVLACVMGVLMCMAFFFSARFRPAGYYSRSAGGVAVLVHQ